LPSVGFIEFVEFGDSIEIPYLKKATAQFMIKNIGGEAIKEDSWTREFLGHCALSKYEPGKFAGGIPYTFRPL